MSTLPRLNGIIAAIEKGRPALVSFAKPEIEEAIALGTSKYDGLMFEMEHGPWDGRALRNTLQYLLNRKQIAQSGSIAPAVTPLVRIPPNGSEMNQWVAKQALDVGVYGIIWPHISTVEQAMNAVAACRYPRPQGAPRYEPAGLRGDGPTNACRYWGLSQQEYYAKADVWPLDPAGEIFVILMIEDVTGIKNLDDILKNVPGIGCVLIGEGDLSQELGVARQYDHPLVRDAMAEVVARCKAHKVTVGHPHVNAGNVQRLIDEGYGYLAMMAPRSFATLEKAISLVG
ncbi:MAG: aldolase/citrate lyase family protein [Deltaproteobacteria bacterium]|nr:aldolase/citrate lyase family protein [Deltaproteobacteria bacterium]